jgi:alpha-L-arabinofuranosidase
VDAAAIRNGGELSVFLVNRSTSRSAPVVIDPADFRIRAAQDADVLVGAGPHAANSWEAPDAVAARAFEGWSLRAGRASTKLPPLSVVASTFTLG